MADAPAWIEAIGTVGAFATGLMLFAGQIADRRRSHASRVAVWTATEGHGRDQTRGQTYRLNIRNDGDQPIYDCRLESHLVVNFPADGENEPGHLETTIDKRFGVIPPGNDVANVVFLGVGDFSEETEAGDLLHVGLPSVRASDELTELVHRGLRFRVSFTDTEGRAWFRDERGRLRRTRRHRPTEETDGSAYRRDGD